MIISSVSFQGLIGFRWQFLFCSYTQFMPFPPQYRLVCGLLVSCPFAHARFHCTRSCVSKLLCMLTGSEYNKGWGIPGICLAPAAAPSTFDTCSSCCGPGHHYRTPHNSFWVNFYAWLEKCKVRYSVWLVLMLYKEKGHYVKLNRALEECQGQWGSSG